MIFYGVVNGHGNSVRGDVVEFFARRQEAERFIAECLEDEPGWVDVLSVVEVEFSQPNGVSSPRPGSDVGGAGVGVFPTREEAEQFIAECLEDEADWADVLSVVEVELASASPWHDPPTISARFIGTLSLLVFVSAGVVISSGLASVGDSAAASAGKPSLRALRLSPFTVQGRHFKANERVEIVLLSEGRRIRRVRASTGGSFAAKFRDVNVDSCRGFTVRALGGLGSRAVLKEGDGKGSAEAEEAWLALLRRRGLEPARKALLVSVGGSAPHLRVRLTLPAQAPRAITFPDALYGATAYAFERNRWRRVDSADVRAQVAPALEPGESAAVTLPVTKATSYRALVPVEGRASWGCT